MCQPPSNLTRPVFLEWRSPRRGRSNPQLMTNDVWLWLIETRLSAYQANDAFNGPNSMNAGPCWCFSRFGQSETALPDGRVVLVGGEHEDYYDPDFYIYNDVVVVEQTGETSIYGYPEQDFPATDFHSATLVDNHIILIGSLGYQQKRIPGKTQVLRLELDTWNVSMVETFGDCPGWIHNHQAVLSENGREILIFRGVLGRCDKSLIENIDDWSLDITTWQWKRLTCRKWPRFVLYRKDNKSHHLWKMRLYAWKTKLPNLPLDYAKDLKKELGGLPDLHLLESLYSPTVATEVIGENEDEYGIYRVRVGEVNVRYDEVSGPNIQVTIEGELPQNVVEQLKNDVMEKFAALERTKIVCTTIE